MLAQEPGLQQDLQSRFPQPLPLLRIKDAAVPPDTGGPLQVQTLPSADSVEKVLTDDAKQTVPRPPHTHTHMHTHTHAHIRSYTLTLTHC